MNKFLARMRDPNYIRKPRMTDAERDAWLAEKQRNRPDYGSFTATDGFTKEEREAEIKKYSLPF